MQHLEVIIRIALSIKPKTIILSKRAINMLSIPTFLEYEMVLNKNTLIIGPFTGILHSCARGEPVKHLEKSLYFIEQYKEIKGAIIPFAFENIDKSERKIKGHLYEPSNHRWIPGIYPYPASLFKYAVLDDEALLFLQNEFGNKFFNAYRFNKWEMYSCLVQDTEISAHIPPTILYKKPEDIICFMDEHPCIYVKPIYGYKGIGIIKIYKNKNFISVLFKQDDNNIRADFSKIEEANLFFENNLKTEEYIVQKKLDITFEKNQVVDFRLVLMKNQYGKWEDLGIYGRIGSPDNIVSNRSSGGRVEKDIFVLKQIYKCSNDEALLYKKQMSVIAVEAAKAMDKSGFTMGRYGIDLAIDKNRNIWIIEMNHTNPNDEIGSYTGDDDLIHKIRFYNMLYTKNLAGFQKDIQHIDINILCGD